MGTDEVKIVNEAGRLLSDREYYESIAKGSNPFGDGRASKRIVMTLLQDL